MDEFSDDSDDSEDDDEEDDSDSDVCVSLCLNLHLNIFHLSSNTDDRNPNLTPTFPPRNVVVPPKDVVAHPRQVLPSTLKNAKISDLSAPSSLATPVSFLFFSFSVLF
jgi:hypothetical protein